MDLGDPGSYLTLAPGVPVYSNDGERLGVVDRVLAEEDKDIFDGIAFDPGAFHGASRYVGASEVDRIYERGVVLALDAARAATLPEPPGD